MPDANPKFKKVPRPSSINKFIEYVKSNKNVTEVIKKSNQLYEIIKKNDNKIKVFLTNIYIVSEADVYEILSKNKEINSIITLSAWNSYTTKAKENCKDDKIGLFTFSEFMGAIYFDGDDFINYVIKKK